MKLGEGCGGVLAGVPVLAVSAHVAVRGSGKQEVTGNQSCLLGL